MAGSRPPRFRGATSAPDGRRVKFGFRFLAQRDDHRPQQRRCQQNSQPFPTAGRNGSSIPRRSISPAPPPPAEAGALQTRAGENRHCYSSQHQQGRPPNPVRPRRRGLAAARHDFIAARQQNGKDDQNGNRSHIDQQLGKPDKFGVELQVEHGQAGKSGGGAQGAMDQIAAGPSPRPRKPRSRRRSDKKRSHSA